MRPAPLEVGPVVLENTWVRLEPLNLQSHQKGFLEAIEQDPDLLHWFPDPARDRAQMLAYMEELLRLQDSGLAYPWATIEKASGLVVGGTGFLNIDCVHHRLEIGHTWISPLWQRTLVNTQVKLLQLTHAFESLGCNRVEFKTDSLNLKSQRAIARLGAREEGTFRNHMIVADGRIRHTVYFSVTAEEWPEVKAELSSRSGQ
jgi:RimJ/RimL family protein N-acetyltransferase